ncbi:hypothetical protein TIFTF001_016654 [Ficus carica]|uniref:Uncharacterized protein n=1 Tax=Ficus carica TaxID=3494 RepID=A0AA88D6D2_FICCA|nr:hypothetical protein TIFTF001_016654 [Ficus carica]
MSRRCCRGRGRGQVLQSSHCYDGEGLTNKLGATIDRRGSWEVRPIVIFMGDSPEKERACLGLIVSSPLSLLSPL